VQETGVWTASEWTPSDFDDGIQERFTFATKQTTIPTALKMRGMK
jgi:hypothetical protein